MGLKPKTVNIAKEYDHKHHKRRFRLIRKATLHLLDNYRREKGF